LIGGKVERYIAGQFADGISEIQSFTTMWIAEHLSRDGLTRRHP
jgi:triacylglycerol esterase/lipase EstA (alpha/beta hydrolase family)